MRYTIGIDLGGTNIAAGLVDEEYRVLCKQELPTKAPRPASAICDDIAGLYRGILSETGVPEQDIRWLGIGSPGLVNVELGLVEYANNLQFYNAPLASLLESRVNKKVYLENDGSAAAYGEFLAGAGRGCQSLVAITLGTGVGSGIILDGKIYAGFNHAGGELGHTVISFGGEACTCGKLGCLEAYCSATALKRDTRRAMRIHQESKLWQVCGGSLENVSGKTAFDAMRLGDKAGTEVVEHFISTLSIGVSNIITILQPEILCVGGGISKEGETLIAPVRARVYELSQIQSEERRTKITAAQLGNDAGLIGAACLGLTQ